MVNGQTTLSVVQSEVRAPPSRDETIWSGPNVTATSLPRSPRTTVWCLTWTVVGVPVAKNEAGAATMIAVAAQDRQCTLPVMMTPETRIGVGRNDTAVGAESAELAEMGDTKECQ